jgi:methionyl-tRNA formyltransferase
MKILLLSPAEDSLMPILRRYPDTIVATTERISGEFVRLHGFDIGVSFGYRHILKPNILSLCRFINLHISYLPWNRGADPNLWSWIDDTPKGVTIHAIDEGLDTGDIITQRFVEMGAQTTLKTSYDTLTKAMIELFEESWPSIRTGALVTSRQAEGGSFHYAQEGRQILQSLPNGYDTPVSMLKGLASR